MQTVIHRRVAEARAGVNPCVVRQVPSGWIVMGDVQVLRGYALLLPDPVVPHLNALTGAARDRFLADMALAGDALLEVTGALRINYSMLGNLEPALHAHLHPRYADEPEDRRAGSPWGYDWSAAPAFDAEVHGELRDRFRAALDARFGAPA